MSDAPTPATILALPERIAGLPAAARERVERLYDVRRVTARSDPPADLEPWLRHRFGSVEAVREQAIVKVTNRATLEGTLFSPLRARRPVDHGGDTDLDPDVRLAEEVAATEDDPFCEPESGTPAHAWGRVRGTRVVTGANAAAADVHHAVLVFDVHDPLAFDADLVGDVLATGRAWAEAARAHDGDAANYLLAWNCLWRAGGSILHGHAQALLGGGPHYAAIARWCRDAAAWRANHGRGLRDDVLAAHRDLGLSIELPGEVSVLAHLTPNRERELLVLAAGEDEREPAFVDAIAGTLLAYRDVLGVRSFNLALWRPPLDADPGDAAWRDLAPMVRVVDRGPVYGRPSDIGAMELYGTPLVGGDPYDTVARLRTALAG